MSSYLSSQSDLVDLLPMLFKNLANGDLNTMVNYRINWTHIKVTSSTTPLSELDCFILNQMCLKSSKGIKLQCSREYWDDETTPRATKLYKLTKEELANLPNNNLVTEQYLATFGYLASLSAKRSNCFF